MYTTTPLGLNRYEVTVTSFLTGLPVTRTYAGIRMQDALYQAFGGHKCVCSFKISEEDNSFEAFDGLNTHRGSVRQV